MEDHHPHHLFFGIYESPSVDGLFATEKPSALADFPPAEDDCNARKQHLPHGANIGDDQDHAPDDIDNPEDYNALWLSLCDDIISHSTTGSDHRGGSEAGPSGTNDRDRQETGEDHRRYCALENMEAPPPRNNDDGDGQNLMRPLQLWPVSTVPYNCSFCQVLREIIHVHYEYKNYMKLEIHGRIGVISHAILERKIANAVNNTSEDDSQFEMLDFCSKSTEEVKQFLTSYCLQRSEEGYIMSNDPLSIFYEALSVGLSPRAVIHNGDFVSGGDFDYQNSEQPEHQPHQQQEVEQDREQANQPATRRRTKRTSRISLAAQVGVFVD